MKKFLAVCICAIMIAQAFTFLLPASAEASSKVYEDPFDYTSFYGDSLFNGGAWTNENPSSGNGKDFTAAMPRVEGGVMKLAKGESAQLNWQKLEGFTFDAAKVYTLKFDVKVTSFGDDEGMSQAKAWKRELYVAPGGYFNQVQFRSDYVEDTIQAGETSASSENYKLNAVYTIRIVWTPAESKIATTINEGDKLVVEGVRTNSAYASAESYMSNWVFRCEDGANEIDNFCFSDGTNEYKETFSVDKTMTNSGLWAAETYKSNVMGAPTIENGVVKLDTCDSVRFNWTEFEGVGTYSANETYTFEFDVKLTDKGTGELWDTSSITRILYVAMGGYYNQVELYDKNGKIRAGDTYIDFDDSVHLNKPLHVKLELKGDTITSTVYKETGEIIATGSRTATDYTDMENRDGAMKYLVFRCEDGAAELDNFKFTVGALANNDGNGDEVTPPTSDAAIITVIALAVISFLGTMVILCAKRKWQE